MTYFFDQLEALDDFGLHVVGKFSHQVKILIFTAFAAVLTVGVYPFLSVTNVLPTPIHFPKFLQFSFGEILKNFFPNFECSHLATLYLVAVSDKLCLSHRKTKRRCVSTKKKENSQTVSLV